MQQILLLIHLWLSWPAKTTQYQTPGSGFRQWSFLLSFPIPEGSWERMAGQTRNSRPKLLLQPDMVTPDLDTEVRVMFFDTAADGLVHNIAYLRFIETNRTLLAERLGYPVGEMLNHGDCAVVVRTEIDYRRPAKLWDILVVHGELEKFERSRFWCAFTIKRPSDGQLLVTCRQMLVVVRLPELKVLRLPSNWYTDFGHLKGS